MPRKNEKKTIENKNRDKNIMEVECGDEIRHSMLDYSFETIDRAIPDLRDGLKPVHRRILYTMYTEGNISSKPYKKCVKAVGSTLGRFHPHGDTSVYDALVRMSQDFKVNLPLIDLHGNGGSIDGDSWAAMRYTESRLAPCTDNILQDLEKNIVDFMDNFDGTEKEPVVLPSKIPMLLINGTSGLAVGMTSNIPSHNLREVIDAYFAYMDNKKITTKELMDYIKGPDYCTGGIITNKDDLYSLYEKGEGNVTIRAKTHIEKGDNGKSFIVVDEIPYTISGNKQDMVSKIINLVIDKTFTEINTVQDESSKEGIRIVIEVKKGYDADNVLNKLYAKTSLQTSEHYNFLVTYDKKPRIINLKQYFEEYFNFNKEFITRKYEYLINKIQDRKEILDGLISAIDSLDVIVEVARYHKTKKDMMDCLINGNTKNINFKHKTYIKIAEKFHFTEKQANAIKSLRLEQLSNLEVQNLIKERDSLLKQEKEYQRIIKTEKNLIREIKKELEDVKKKYASSRKTVVKNIKQIKYKEQKQIEDIIVLIDRFNYIKTVPYNNANLSNEKVKECRLSIISDSEDKIVLFTNKGHQYSIKAVTIPAGKITDKGMPIENLTKLKDEYIVSAYSMKELINKKLLFHTKRGYVKLVNGKEFDVKTSASIAGKLRDDDEYIFIRPIKKAAGNIVVITEAHIGLKYGINEVSLMKKQALGVQSIDLKDNDFCKYIEFEDDFHYEDIDIKKIRKRKRGNKGVNVA